MPRATRYLMDGYVYHLTHRCSDGAFFLRFRAEREAYREWLRIGAARHGVPVLGYCITGNHVHVVVEALDRHAVAAMMQLAAGAVAQLLNRRKEREGSVWEHPYHCTRVQDGRHLLHCLRYVDLNMVRAGKVAHPRAWRWCSYDELTGQRQRYRIVDRDRLLSLTSFPDLDTFAARHEAAIEERLAAAPLAREAWWSESVAVGDEVFVEAAAETNAYRHSMQREELSCPQQPSTWLLRETATAYTADSAKKSSL